MRLVVILGVTALALSSASVARAATAQVTMDQATFQADPGEANHVKVTAPNGSAQFFDSGATITPGTGCAAVDANTVLCSARIADGVVIHAGDLADFVSVAPIASFECCERHSLFGDDGDDVLVGGPNADGLFGGPGKDTLRGGGDGPVVHSGDCELCGPNFLGGGPGDDLLLGGAGMDLLSGAEGADVMSGGGGLLDDVTYPFGQGPVTVRIDDKANDGMSGEGDDVRSDVEVVEGTDGNDLLVGNVGANVLFGWAGNDVVIGGRGRDILFGDTGQGGGHGQDTLKGGYGPDQLWGGRGDDTLRPGPGRDAARGNAGEDTLYARDHERDRLSGGKDRDRARIDHLDLLAGIEKLF